MPLDKREREELAKKIMEQRRSTWKGEATVKRPPKKKLERKKTEQTSGRQRKYRKTVPASDRQQKHEEPKEGSKPDHWIVDGKPAEERREVKQISDRQQERKEPEQTSELHYRIIDEKPVEKREEVKQTIGRQSDNKPKAKKRDRDIQWNVPGLKLSLLVIIGLIAAIMIGVAIGYWAAVRDLINI